MSNKDNYPKIYLTIDNCFAIKRWVRPKDWMKVVSEIGNISCIEASTDNEIDPLFNTQEFRDDWVSEVREYGEKYGLRVVSFYSGYATYRTVGLTSWAPSSRKAIRERYFNNVVDVAAKLGAQVGNTISAFSEPVLDDPAMFADAEHALQENLEEMSRYAAEKNVQFGYEQMYTPNQGFWTIDSCSEWMNKIFSSTGKPLYITIDTAHQVGQNAFLPPGDDDIEKMAQMGSTAGFRMGRAITEMVESKQHTASEIKEAARKFHYLFSQPKDSDVFAWFSELGCYSPLVHLQQTDGTYSGHKPFTEQFNKSGIVDPIKTLKAIAESYDRPAQPGMPPKVDAIYLAFELFFGITDEPRNIIEAMRESVEYWRQYIPEDGLNLGDLI